MTIAISCCLADGAIVGADSAITVFAPGGGVAKVYNDAEKIFPLFSLHVGLVTFGVASLGQRTIRSYGLEFELEHRSEELDDLPLEDLAHRLWDFFRRRYDDAIGPDLARDDERDYDEIPPEERPVLGLHLVGYSPDSYLPEAFQIYPMIPDRATGVQRLRSPGEFGATWAGQYDGISRFHHGYDGPLMEEVIATVVSETQANQDAEQALRTALQGVLTRHQKMVPFQAMPLQQGVDYVKFLLDIMIGQHHFVSGAPTCGGPVRIAVVTRERGYQEVTSDEIQLRTS